MTDMHREGFEDWAGPFGYLLTRWDSKPKGGRSNDYMKLETEDAWTGWQAALRYRDEQEKGDV